MSSASAPRERFFQRNRLRLDIAGALLSMLMHALGLYFVYRWGRLLQRADQETKEALLGETLSQYLTNGEYIAMVVAIYLGYKMMVFLAQAADWQQYLEVAQKQQSSINRKR